MNQLEILKQWILESKKIVFFGGAGVSTESGIPDFRSVDGLYNLKYKYPPEKILSRSFFKEHIDEFYEFYRDKMIYLNAEPNITHKVLANMEQSGKKIIVITQNIDGLHQKAGSKNVIELHGSVLRNYCMKCNKFYTVDTILEQEVPVCSCGGIIKPDVVLYEEGLKNVIIEKAISALVEADMVIVGGTSLSVYPAAGMIQYYKGNKLVLINKTSTSYDKYANLLIQESLGKIFTDIEINV
ncbi:NAD-dependent protein deacylase [Anaeromicropila populeti]|uniref:NAD-dependent protein deacetylase n=1 Tax=Anaeromicropila populeti TaxID=37658 RepID=A0A1I6LAA5_9FIRM|nr:NAD-dependent protein deacylase [Anaeromicropila populeti]SFS00405.1 NAD-dependent deacetylase [Anaeromicropila populeti]